VADLFCECNNLVLSGVAGDEVVEVGDDVHTDGAGQVIPDQQKLGRGDKGDNIPHICHFLYTGRIFKFQILHLKIFKNTPKRVKYVVFCVQSRKIYT